MSAVLDALRAELGPAVLARAYLIFEGQILRHGTKDFLVNDEEARRLVDLAGADVPARNASDATLLPPTPPLAVVRPATTEAVSATLRICHAHGQAVVLQGGLTGLVGAAHPHVGEIALSLECMTGVEAVDGLAGTLTALAGTPLQIVQQAADDAGFQCGIDLPSRGSAAIGGTVYNLAQHALPLRAGRCWGWRWCWPTARSSARFRGW